MKFNVLVLAACCVTATAVMAGEPPKPKKEKAQSMSEPNPIKAYVNVIPQGGEGRDTAFLLCQHSEKGCEKPVHTKKHLAVSNSPFQVPVDTVKKSNSQTDY